MKQYGTKHQPQPLDESGNKGVWWLTRKSDNGGFKYQRNQMSKKIWRGRQHDHGDEVPGASILPCHAQDADCTIITDAACFPVKEAMAILHYIYNVAGKDDPFGERHQKAEQRYLRAVAKMKKKAKGKTC